MIEPLNIVEAQFIAYRLAITLMNSKDEPMPPFETRFPGKLESCLLEPFQTYSGKFLHYSFASRAAVLFYLIIKNHCFVNGNKRMAVVLTMTFCYKNKRWININPVDLYNLATIIAESKVSQRDRDIKKLSSIFKSSLEKLD